MGQPLERVKIARGAFLTNGKTLVRVCRVLDSEVVVEDALSPADDPEVVSLSPQDIAAYRNVELVELEIPEEWRLEDEINIVLNEIEEQTADG